MGLSYKLSDAIHILAYIEILKKQDLSSKSIAASIGANASVVRHLMLDLRSANLLTTHQGIATPQLAKSPDDISIYDVYCAINMPHNLLNIDPKTNPNCLVGGHIQETLNHFYSDIESAAYDQMKTISLAHVIQDILK